MIPKKNLKDKWFIFPIIILLTNLLVRIYWTFINLREYPFESITDAGNWILTTFFLAQYGLYGTVPNYWGGFNIFIMYPPGFSFFSLPWYYLTSNLVSAIFLSLICVLGLGFAFIFIGGHFMRISVIKRGAFFLLFFASPVVMDYIQIGRYPELLGWVLFIPLFFLVMWYKNHRINKKFLIFIPIYASIILTHVYVLFITSFLIVSLFIIKSLKEKIIIVLSIVLSFILSSFWWPKAFLFLFTNSSKIKGSFELLSVHSIISYNTIIMLIFLFVFYFYYKSCKNKKRELLFYSPLLILSLLILTRLITLIPIFNSLFVMPYNIFFLFLIIYLFFNINFNLSRILNKMLPVFLILLSSSIFIYSFTRAEYSPRESNSVNPQLSLEKELLLIMPEIEGRYLFVTQEMMTEEIPHKMPKIYSAKIMDYATIYYNLSTPFGKVFAGFIPGHKKELFEKLYGCGDLWEDCSEEREPPDCEVIKDIVIEQNVKSLIASNEDRNFLKKCGYQEKLRKKEVCLFIT